MFNMTCPKCSWTPWEEIKQLNSLLLFKNILALSLTKVVDIPWRFVNQMKAWKRDKMLISGTNSIWATRKLRQVKHSKYIFLFFFLSLTQRWPVKSISENSLWNEINGEHLVAKMVLHWISCIWHKGI